MAESSGVSDDRGKCRIRWSENGKRRSITLPIPYSPAGIKRAAKIRERHIAAFQAGKNYRGPAPTFFKLAQTRLDSAKLTPETRRTQLSYLNNYWSPFFDRQIDSIQYDELLDVFKEVLQGAVAPKTAKHIFSAGSGVFELAIRSGWRTDNPAKVIAADVKLTKRIIDPFTKEERDIILDSLPLPHQHLFYAIRFYCGLRPSEAIALRWSDYKDGQFAVTKRRVRGTESSGAKNNTERLVPVHPYVAGLLRSTPRQMKDDHIITNQHGNGYRSATRLADAFSATLKRCGIRYRSPYNVRHTCATMMLEAGMKPAYCAKVLGHSLQMFFNRYAEWIDREESQAQAKIWAEIQ